MLLGLETSLDIHDLLYISCISYSVSQSNIILYILYLQLTRIHISMAEEIESVFTCVL